MGWFILLGVSTGMRTMTAMTVLCWFAYLKLLPQTGWAFWVGSLVTTIVFTVLALGETIGDTLPRTPSRLDAGPLGARLVFGMLVGALAAHSLLEPAAGGAILGVIGVLIGAYGGYRLRMLGARLVRRDLPVALLESVVALGFALWPARWLHAAAVVEGFAPATKVFHSFTF